MTQSINIIGNGGDQPIPFRMWWGLGFCAALVGLIYAFGPYSADVVLASDQGDFWYFWQLAEPTAVTRLSAWLPYIVHQLAIWFLIYHAQRVKPKYIFGLHSFNVMAIAINILFVFAHIVQTRFFYDGLAQDVHEATSMMSVVLMLFMILIMENKRRGMFFGKGVKAINGVGDTLRRYHGYYFSWAIIYTFWYHPIELTSGHIAGFAYMFLLLMQSSLFFTRYHTNRWWTMFLEVVFVVHGALVAAFLMNPGDHQFWSMFLFGGMAIFLITQLHGLGLSTAGKLKLALPVIAVIVAFYLSFPDLWLGLTRLPLTMYLGTGLMFFILWGLIRCGEKVRDMLHEGAKARQIEAI
jgi:hypothetical protein